MPQGTGPRSHGVGVGPGHPPANASHALQFSSVEITSKGGNATSYFEIGSSCGRAIGRAW